MLAEEDELLDREERAEEQRILEQNALADEAKEAGEELRKLMKTANRADAVKLEEECDIARMDIEECDEAVKEQVGSNEALGVALEKELKLLAETEDNLQQMTDELEEILHGQGQSLGSVAPELEVAKQREIGAKQATAAQAKENGGGGGGGGGGYVKTASGWSVAGDSSSASTGAASTRSMWQQKAEEQQREKVRRVHYSTASARSDDGLNRRSVGHCVSWSRRTILSPRRSARHSVGGAWLSCQTTRSTPPPTPPAATPRQQPTTSNASQPLGLSLAASSFPFLSLLQQASPSLAVCVCVVA